MADERFKIGFYQGRGVHESGTILFRSPDQLSANRALDGLYLLIPAELSLSDKIGDSGQRPDLVSTTISVWFADEYIGTATDSRRYNGGKYDGQQMQLRVHLPTAIVREIERRRDSGVVSLRYDVIATTARANGDGREHPDLSVGQVRVNYRPEVWSTMLRTVGLADNIHVEVRLPPAPTPEWEEVFLHVRRAQEAIVRGGHEGTRVAMNEARDALEVWHKKVRQPSIGGATPSQRSEAERIDAIRADLHSLAHLAAHPNPDAHLRDRRRAVLLVSTLAALIAIEIG